MREGDILYLRVSKSGKGLYMTSTEVGFGLRANRLHVEELLKGARGYAVFEAREKNVTKQAPIEEPEENDEYEY